MFIDCLFWVRGKGGGGGGGGGGRVLRDRRAPVLQWGGQCSGGEQYNDDWLRVNPTL